MNLKKRLNEKQNILSINDQEYTGVEIKTMLEKTLSSFLVPQEGAIGIICTKSLNFLLGLFTSILLEKAPIFFPLNGSIDFYKKYIFDDICSILICDRENIVKMITDKFKIYKISNFYVCCNYEFKTESIFYGFFGQFTSGTTDVRKLVVRSNEFLEMEINSLEKICTPSINAVFFNMAPLFHSYGYCGGLIWPLCRGSFVHMIDKFMPTQCKKIWNKINPSVVYGIPYQYEMFLKTPGKNLTKANYIFSAGSPLKKELRTAFYHQYKLLLSINYGSTEFGTICIYPTIPLEIETGHVGGLLNHFHKAYTIDDEIFLDCDEKSYYFKENIPIISTGDTGEIINFNEIILKSRIRKVINVAGEKVNPVFVEQILRSIPSVNECLVFGKKVSETIEVIVAYIELHDAEAIKEKDIIDYCKLHLSSYEIPKEIHIVSNLKRTTTGKLSVDYYRSLS